MNQDTKQEIKRIEQGQSLTEFAISLVFLLTLLAGVADLGRAFFAYIMIRDAVQEGAVYGAIHADNANLDTLVRERVETAFTNPDTPTSPPIDLNSLTISTTVNGAPCAGQDTSDQDGDGNTTETNSIIVNADFTLPVTMPFLGTILGSQEINMSTSVENTTMVPICK